jgi:hypothetical protein
VSRRTPTVEAMAETASRAEARAPSDGGPLSALRITPADDDKFFPVEAFRLEPGAPVGLVTAVDPFRDDAFKPVLAAHPMEGRALADLMIVIPKRSRHTGKECSQPPFAIDQRQNAQIFAVKTASQMPVWDGCRDCGLAELPSMRGPMVRIRLSLQRRVGREPLHA